MYASSRRARREGSEPQPRSMNARRLRSANRAEEHAARRRSRRLHLQELIHRHLWRVRGWQRMQNVWTEWGRSAALPLPPPAPPQTRPLQIVDPKAFPVLLAGCPVCTDTIPIYSHRTAGRRALLERHRHPLDKPLSTLVAPDFVRHHPISAPDPVSICPRLV